jgi:hypothetical protein
VMYKYKTWPPTSAPIQHGVLEPRKVGHDSSLLFMPKISAPSRGSK